jgi:hypothetical protein
MTTDCFHIFVSIICGTGLDSKKIPAQQPALFVVVNFTSRTIFKMSDLYFKKALMAYWTLINKKSVPHNKTSLLTLFIAFTVLFYSCTPRLRNGIYKGNELIIIAPDNTFWPGIIKPWASIKDTFNRDWFHEVIISVNGTLATITKTPFYIKDGIKQFTDSTGGYYYYKGEIDYDKKDRTFTIYCSLNSCKFCPKTATAPPLYTYENYEIRRQKNKLVVNTNYEKGLIFARQ